MISNVDWSDILHCNMTQSAFTLFHSKIRELHDKCFPLQTLKKTCNNKKPWLSDTLREAIKKIISYIIKVWK